MDRIGLVVGAAVTVAGIAVSVVADEVQFRNGDRISGQVISAVDGKLTIKSAVAGEITVDMKDVDTFTTDEPVAMELEDGSLLKQRVAAGEPGTIQTEAADPLPAATIPLASIGRVNPAAVAWTGSVVANAAMTRGNSDTVTAALRADAVRRDEHDRITLGAGYLFSRQEDPDSGEKTTTADAWFGQAKYDYFLTPNWYTYADIRVDRDEIANLNLRVAPSVGVGYQWVERADFTFNTEGGLAWVYEDYDTGESEDHMALRLGYKLTKALNDKVSFFHTLTYLPSLEQFSDFNLLADAGVRADLTTSFFTELKLEWQHDSTPAAGNTANDLRFMGGVGWSF